MSSDMWTSTMTTITTETSKGVGSMERRRMIRKWKLEGQGLSLKEWARRQSVGDAALAWVEGKKAKL